MTSDEVHHDKVLSRALATSATRICITPTFQAVSQRLPSEGTRVVAYEVDRPKAGPAENEAGAGYSGRASRSSNEGASNGLSRNSSSH